MIRSLYTAVTGMVAQQVSLDVTANNLANVNTTGYKKSRGDFQDLMYQVVEEPGTTANQAGSSPTGIQIGLGTRTAAVGKLHSQGDFQSTANPLDVAIEGDGFFQVTLPNGDTAYTRAGAFKLDDQGNVVTSDGYPLTAGISIPSDATGITISTDGKVTVRLPGTATPSSAGDMQVARFPNPAGLRSYGKNLYQETESSGTATLGTPGENGAGTLLQNFLEGSNVSVVEEIVQMVTGQRAYEANSKVIQTADQLLSTAVNLKR